MATRTIGGCGQLATSGKTVGHETLEKDRAEVGPGQVDGGGMSCRSGADDDLGRERSGIGTQVGWERNIRLWNAALSSSRFFRGRGPSGGSNARLKRRGEKKGSTF